MNNKIVEASGPVLLVGGGDCPENALTKAFGQVQTVVAADGGARAVLAQGRVPDAVIGDLDSLDADDLARLPPDRVHRVAEQDSTDFDKCLRSIKAPMVLGHGFLGARLDHQLAVMTVLVRRAAQKCVLVGAEDVVCVLPPRLEIGLPPGSRLSLFPMRPVHCQSEGVRWPTGGIRFAPAGQVGTSNEVSAPGRVVLEPDAPFMLLILPAEAQEALVQALTHAPSWSAAPTKLRPSPPQR